MMELFGGGIGRAFQQAAFHQMPRRDQNAVLQTVYDKGYSVKDLAKFTEIPATTIYSRIDAHRGRGAELTPGT